MNAFILDNQDTYQQTHPEQIIVLAKEIISDRLHRSEDISITSPTDVQRYLQLQLAE